MNNPLRILSTLFTGAGQPPAPPPETPPPTPANESLIKAPVPTDVVEAASLRPKLPREAVKQHNREIEQRMKAASLHRPVITRGMPHVRGR